MESTLTPSRYVGIGLYTFPEAARIIGIKPAKLRRWVGQYRRKVPGADPFAVKRFDTDGHRVFATLQQESQDERLVVELGKGQLVLDTIVRPFFRKLEYRNGGVAPRDWPLHREGRTCPGPERTS